MFLRDGEELDVAIEFFDRKVLDESVSAMDLYCLGSNPLSYLAREQCCLTSHQVDRLAALSCHRGPICQKAGCANCRAA